MPRDSFVGVDTFLYSVSDGLESSVTKARVTAVCPLSATRNSPRSHQLTSRATGLELGRCNPATVDWPSTNCYEDLDGVDDVPGQSDMQFFCSSNSVYGPGGSLLSGNFFFSF